MDSLGLDVINLGGTKPECFFQAVGEDARAVLVSSRG